LEAEAGLGARVDGRAVSGPEPAEGANEATEGMVTSKRDNDPEPF